MCLKSSTQTQQYPLRSRVNAVMSQNIFCRCTDTMLARWFLVPSLIIKHAQHVPKYCKNSKSVSMSCCSGRHVSINHFLTPSIFLTAYPVWVWVTWQKSNDKEGYTLGWTHQFQSITELSHRDRKPHTLTVYVWPIQKYENVFGLWKETRVTRGHPHKHTENMHTLTHRIVSECCFILEENTMVLKEVGCLFIHIYLLKYGWMFPYCLQARKSFSSISRSMS